MKEQLALVPYDLPAALEFCKAIASSGLVPDYLKGRPQDVLVILMHGRDTGLSPMASIRNLQVIKGKVTESAQLMVARALQHPDCEFFKPIASTKTESTWVVRRKSWPHGQTATVGFTIADAAQMGLAGNHNWKAQPEIMLNWRAAAKAARLYFPETTSGLYTHEEMGGDDPTSSDDMGGGTVEVATAEPYQAPLPAAIKSAAPQAEVLDAEIVSQPVADDAAAYLDAIAQAVTLEDLHTIAAERLAEPAAIRNHTKISTAYIARRKAILGEQAQAVTPLSVVPTQTSVNAPQSTQPAAKPNGTFGERLRDMRKAVKPEGLSQRAMADLIGVSPGFFLQVENGRQNFGPENLQSCVAVLSNKLGLEAGAVRASLGVLNG